jgi:hypothetical protein
MVGTFVGAAASKPAQTSDETSEAEKIAKADATYQPMPKGPQRRAICLQFEPPDRCKIVQGPIVANGWCQYFAARENAQ